MKQVDGQSRTFLVAAITLSLAVWDISFNWGVYGEVFYNKIFLVWVASTAIFLACLVLPKHKMPFYRWGLLILLFPSLWVVLNWLDYATDYSLLDAIVFNVVVLIVAVCLPYMLYVIGMITNPEIVSVTDKRMRYGLFMIAIVIGLLGYGIGRNQDLFLTCQDFDISGDKIPDNCYNPDAETTIPDEESP